MKISSRGIRSLFIRTYLRQSDSRYSLSRGIWEKLYHDTLFDRKEGRTMRIGMGYDVHKLTENRKLILGGVEIPYEKGLLGHSDADVVVHAVMDALLGAAALGDIGKHFPDTDPAYEGISSITLLKHVGDLLEKHNYVVENIDATIIAQRPKLLHYMPQMVKNVAQALGLEESQVNIKATTEEGLGFTGSGEGISAHAVCLLMPLMDIGELSYGPESGCSPCTGCCRDE